MTTTSFLAAYDGVLAAKWPAGTRGSRVPTPYGVTHVNSCGPEDAPPLVLLAGGGSTSTVWYAQAAHLGRTHRVHAVDLIGDPGRSVAGERPIRTVEDLTTWLDAVVDGLGAGRSALCGHSYGAWIALHYALHAPPHRVRKLILLDPTQCFAGFRPGYLLHALPMLLRPGAKRTRTFLEWETGRAALDRTWLRLRYAAADFPSVRPVTGPRPEPEALGALDVPTLILLAEQSRAHDPARVAAAAARLLPHARTATIPGATHHTLPLHEPTAGELNRRIEDFLMTR
ncbi:alpha/beta fold hydrolase [Streptomyces sp. Ncost-T10-10d]|uniref:alpha/beta fold hydrolase n=1 Tax=Streptomyces sp. Ncost-T10-10d TaxID=1839774 RepID=UPI00081D5AD0|nr:alpha/beta hydrolase [Streptomyces sp. Ncost-T10-10d]SCF79805.1 Pimeloyl-ACP methyl ester carboxylesterase [Streptomyces sp. Ncost-T10-10d]